MVKGRMRFASTDRTEACMRKGEKKINRLAGLHSGEVPSAANSELQELDKVPQEGNMR